MSPSAHPEILSFQSQVAWEMWLAKNYSLREGICLRLYKKGSGIPSVTYAEALDEALCYGWIDGIKKSYDEVSWLQRFTPRRAKSVWSKVNTGHVARLIDAGKMREPGHKEVEQAKADGRWDTAYHSSKTITVPDDFQAALDKHPKAKAFFENLNKQNRYAILYRITTAKKPETRTKRITEFMAMLAKGEKLYP